MNATLINVVEQLHDSSTKVSVVFFNGYTHGEWFEITVAVRQGCVLSSSLFNIFIDKIMTDALD